MQNKNAVVGAILKEIEGESFRLEGHTVNTIYFGGGTPSLLSEGELNDIIDRLRRHYAISADAEITLEANPDDITNQALQQWQRAGVNRLSIGVQSFREEDLLWMNRAHTASQSIKSLQLAQDQGFSNITIDLIYGTPALSDTAWEANVQQAIALDIPHLSCYALTVEPKTALDKMIRSGKSADTDPGQQSRQFLLLMDWLQAAGFEHYEISNFARPGWRSRHNSAYWQGISYLGFGPGAHSFNGSTRSWNISNNTLYLQGIEQGLPVREEEVLTTENRINEYVMTSLRTIEGLDLRAVRENYGDSYAQMIVERADKFLALQRMQLNGEVIQLTNEGKLFADGIAADLFV